MKKTLLVLAATLLLNFLLIPTAVYADGGAGQSCPNPNYCKP